MASSSSSPGARSIVSGKLYDAFISHRGPDVKDTLGIQLYDFLKAEGYNPFLDREEIKAGDSITSAIHNAICSSRVQIAIFSTGFADSSWCLDEVVLMLKETDARFIPLFYGVEPWDLRHIDDDNSQYAKAFADYQSKGINLDKLDGWRKALVSAANISGHEIGQHQEDLLKKIVSDVIQFLQEKDRLTPLPVAKYPVGIDELVQDFERRCPERTGMVGIFGLGGSGKTTLAKELFNKKSSAYHRSCFLSDVRESHAGSELHRLQRQLIKDLFDIDKRISSVNHGKGKLKNHLRRARNLHFLIVVDDIDHQEQLDALLPEGVLGRGSLFIITTRDQSVLRGVDARYEMKKMDWNHSTDLFCSHAFRGRDPPTSFQKLVESFVEFCGGLPLSLQVLGAHVYERDEYYWNLELGKVKKITPEDILKRLKISFDGLDREEKQIFIDIACFFNRRHVNFNLRVKAITVWKACGWSAEHALQTLQDKCLIKVDDWHGMFETLQDECLIKMSGYEFEFEMHDHLRDLGRQMTNELGPPRLWQPQVLRSMQVEGFRQILEKTEGTCFYFFKDSSLDRQITYFISNTNLVSLEIRGGAKKLDNIPSWIPLHKLQYLRINRVEDLWSSFKEQLETKAQATSELRLLHIVGSPSLRKLPNLGEMFYHLEELCIERSLGKTDTRSFVQSIKQLSKLRSLILVDSKGRLFKGTLDLRKGRDCSTNSRMNSLETIILGRIQNIFKLVISEKMCPKLQSLDIRGMKNLKEIELKSFMKVGDRSRLEEITIDDCPELKSVRGVEELRGLKRLVIRVTDNGNAWFDNYIGGLRGLPAKTTILAKQVLNRSLFCKVFNRSLFSEVIDTEAVSEIRFEYILDYKFKLKSSLNAITIHVLFVSRSSYPQILYGNNHLFSSLFSVIIAVLTEGDSECSLFNSYLEKGYKVKFKLGEEGKALMLLQRIVDQLQRILKATAA